MYKVVFKYSLYSSKKLTKICYNAGNHMLIHDMDVKYIEVFCVQFVSHDVEDWFDYVKLD